MGPRRVRYAAASGVLSMRNVACHPRPVVTWSRSFGWLVRFLSVLPPCPLAVALASLSLFLSLLVSSSLASLFRALALSLSSSKPPLPCLLPSFLLFQSLSLSCFPSFCLVSPKICSSHVCNTFASSASFLRRSLRNVGSRFFLPFVSLFPYSLCVLRYIKGYHTWDNMFMVSFTFVFLFLFLHFVVSISTIA